MYSESNHIYTNRGIYSVYDLYVLSQNNLLNTIQFMTFDLTTYTYKFVNATAMTVTEKITDIYETVFYDLYSDRNIVINVTSDSVIYQFDLVNMTKNKYLGANKLKVNQYMQSLTPEELKLTANSIQNMINFSVNMPNISLGDSLVRFTSKTYKNQELVYNILGEDNKPLPIFIGQAVNSFYNFVLMS